MISLENYLNGLVSSIAEGRASADALSARIAEAYKNDELLRNFSVPRMKIGNINMSVPVAFAGENTGATTTLSLIKQLDFNAIVETLTSTICECYFLTQRMLSANNGNDNERLDRSLQYVLQIAVNQLYNELFQLGDPLDPTDADTALQTKAEEICNAFYDNLPSNEPVFATAIDLGNEAALYRVKYDLERLFILQSVSNQGIMLKATAQELSEVNSDAIFHIDIVMKEDGMQWAFSRDNEGNINANLVPE